MKAFIIHNADNLHIYFVCNIKTTAFQLKNSCTLSAFPMGLIDVEDVTVFNIDSVISIQYISKDVIDSRTGRKKNIFEKCNVDLSTYKICIFFFSFSCFTGCLLVFII